MSAWGGRWGDRWGGRWGAIGAVVAAPAQQVRGGGKKRRYKHPEDRLRHIDPPLIERLTVEEFLRRQEAKNKSPESEPEAVTPELMARVEARTAAEVARIVTEATAQANLDAATEAERLHNLKIRLLLLMAP